MAEIDPKQIIEAARLAAEEEAKKGLKTSGILSPTAPSDPIAAAAQGPLVSGGNEVKPVRRRTSARKPKAVNDVPASAAQVTPLPGEPGEPAMAVAEPVATDAADQLKMETERRKQAVLAAKTPEELCDIVASFEKIASLTQGSDISGREAAEDMRKKIADLSGRTSEDISMDLDASFSGVLEYGIADRFRALVSEMIRRNEDKADTRHAAGKNKGLDEAIAKMTAELDALRTAAANAEYQNTGVWARLKQTLGVTPRETDKAPEAVKYKEVLNDLLELKLKRLESMKEDFKPSEYKNAMAETLQLFKIESKLKFDDAYTEATKERKGLSEKALGAVEDIGRWYNKQPLWAKVGVGATLMGGAFLSGGSLGALVAPIMARKAIGAAGMYAAFDPMLEKMVRNRMENTIVMESQEAAEKLGESGISMKLLRSKLQREIEELDQNFLRRNRERLARKTSIALFAGAIGFGSALFSSEAAEAKEAAKATGSVAQSAVENGTLASASGTGGEAAEIVEQAVRDGAEVKPGVPLVMDAQAPSAPPVADAPVAAAEASPSGAAGAGSVSEAPASIEAAPSPDVSDAIARDASIEEFINRDITVEKGDSVWKISGRLADQLSLEGAERTHFIDSLKDKFGDVQLSEGQTINMAEKGIDKEFIENALGKSASLTEAQVESITVNDAEIAKYALEHPDVTLTEEVIDRDILHHQPGVSSEALHGNNVSPEMLADSSDDTSAASSVATTPSAESMASVSPAEAPLEGLNPAEMRRGSDWFMQVFRVDEQSVNAGKDWISDKKEILSTKMSDILKVESNGAVSVAENDRFNPAQSKNLQEFVSELPKVFPDGKASLGDFFKVRPDISVGEYLARVAKVVPQGTRIGLYTTTN